MLFMRNISIVIVLSLIYGNTSFAENIKIIFNSEDFIFYNLQTTTTLRENASLIVIAPNKNIENKFAYVEDCDIIISKINMTNGYIDKYPNYLIFSCKYLAPYGKKITSYNVEQIRAELIKSNVYIPSTLCLSTTSQSDEGQPIFPIVNTEAGSYMDEYINRYVDYRYPHENNAIICDIDHTLNDIICDFQLSPFYVIGTDLYLIKEYSIDMELDDISPADIPSLALSYISEPFISTIIINPENIDDYTNLTSIPNQHIESFYYYDKYTHQIQFYNTYSDIFVFDLNGNLVINSNKSPLNVASLQKGIYIVHAISSDNVITAKFVKI